MRVCAPFPGSEGVDSGDGDAGEASRDSCSSDSSSDSVSFRGTSREPQGLWASHTAQRTEQARSTLFTLLFFSSPGLEP